MYRAEVRARNLLSKDCSVDYDLVTGAVRPFPGAPAKPKPLLPDDVARMPLGSDHH